MSTGLQLAARFALPAYRSGSCGTGKLPIETIIRCIQTGKCKGVRTEFGQFANMAPYLTTIKSIISTTDAFKPEVTRAYWLGSSALNKAKPKHFELLLSEMIIKGYPKDNLDEVRKIAPATFIPMHLYQVLLSHFLSGGTIKELDGVNNCMVRFGVITEISEEKAKVDLVSLTRKRRKLVTTNLPEEVEFDFRLFRPALKVGNTVAVHLKWVAVDLTRTPKDSANLLHWTKEIVKAYNS